MNAALLAAGTLLMLAGVRLLLVCRLDGVAAATVIAIHQEPNGYRGQNSYTVTYQFSAASHTVAQGSYLLENPATLGDMPRLGSDLSVGYSSLDPLINEPWAGDLFDPNQIFLAGMLAVVGMCLIAAGIWLHT